MGCSGCPSHQSGPQAELFVDVVIFPAHKGNTFQFEGISMSKLNASGRSLQFEDQKGYLHIILLGGDDRVEISSREPLPKETEE